MKVVLVIASQGFREEEYFEPRQILEQAGIEVKTASLTAGLCQSTQGRTTQAELSVSQITPQEYEAVVFIGGQGMIPLVQNPELIKLAQDFASAGKLTAAICIAPEILAYAGLLKGRQATATPMAQKTLEQAKAQFIGQPVTQDGKIITASGPTAASEFGRAIVENLSQ